MQEISILIVAAAIFGTFIGSIIGIRLFFYMHENWQMWQIKKKIREWLGV